MDVEGVAQACLSTLPLDRLEPMRHPHLSLFDFRLSDTTELQRNVPWPRLFLPAV